jgi:hypothetical protein
MARFAQDCARKVKQVTRELEVELGPETSTLGFRFGLHSGPVTGGVLRGQRARFQLFGDTVNTASRIESTGKKGKIQVSTATASLITEAGKGDWLTPREDIVLAKGIGLVQTCWLSIKADARANPARGGSLDRSAASESSDIDGGFDKLTALVDWHTGTLAQFLKVVVAEKQLNMAIEDSDKHLSKAEQTILGNKKAPIEEIAGKISFPPVQNLQEVLEAAESIELGMAVMMQLRTFVWSIAATYVHPREYAHFDHWLLAEYPLTPSIASPFLVTGTKMFPSTTSNTQVMW